MIAHKPWAFGGSGAPDGEVWVWSYDSRPWQTGEADDTRLFSAPPEIAEQVVRAVNAHDDLLAALEEQVAEFDKRLREYVEGGNDEIAGIAMQHHGDRMDRARAAIAKARRTK